MESRIVREAHFADRVELERFLERHFSAKLDSAKHPEIDEGAVNIRGLAGHVMLGKALFSDLLDIADETDERPRSKVLSGLRKMTGQKILNPSDLPKALNTRGLTMIFAFTDKGVVIQPSQRQEDLVKTKRVQVPDFEKFNPLLLPK